MSSESISFAAGTLVAVVMDTVDSNKEKTVLWYNYARIFVFPMTFQLIL
jgi:hypothetical protein